MAGGLPVGYPPEATWRAFLQEESRTPPHTHQGISQLQVKANSEGALGFSLHPEHHDLTSDYFLNTLL